MTNILIGGDHQYQTKNLEIEREWFNAPFWQINHTDFKVPDLSNYDVLRLYLFGDPSIITKIKEKYPEIKIILSLDSEYWQVTCPWIRGYSQLATSEVLMGLQTADLVFCWNPISHLWFLQNNIKSILGFFTVLDFKRPLLSIQPKSYQERLKEKKVAILVHCFPFHNNPRINLEIAKILGLNPVIIGAPQNDVLKDYPNAEFCGLVIDSQKYFEILNDCLIGLDCWYAGGNRFGIECASIGLPVIGTENALSLTLLSPEFTCINGDISVSVKKAKLLIEDKALYNGLSIRIRERTLTYLSEEAHKKRYMEAVKQYLGIDL